jgi:DNA-binding MarR family transcriptional regulator
MEKQNIIIDREDFEALHWIEYMGLNNPNKLAPQLSISKEEANDKLIELERKGLIKIEHREGRIYGSQLTEEGKRVWEDDKYSTIREELD